MPQRLGTVPHTESINAKSISSKKPYQVAITQRYPARNQNVRYCMHSPLALYCACQPGRRSQRGVQYLNLQIIQPASPIYQILPIVCLLMNPKRQPYFAIFCNTLPYFSILRISWFTQWGVNSANMFFFSNHHQPAVPVVSGKPVWHWPCSLTSRNLHRSDPRQNAMGFPFSRGNGDLKSVKHG